jgi:hypothetical protein
MNDVEEADGGGRGGGNDDDDDDDDVGMMMMMSSSSLSPFVVVDDKTTEEEHDDFDDEHPSERFKHFAASVAILAGTAVGSGCLAIPRATAPAGVIPSSSAMTLVWAFLCFSALCIVESVEATSRKMKRKDVPLHAVAEQVRAKNEKYYTIRSFVSFRFVSFRAFGTHNSAVCLLFTHHLNAFLVLSLSLRIGIIIDAW